MNIGLVLGGGMAKGAYQIGVLKALNKYLPQDEIKYISCSSVGVLNGYAYATGNLNKAEKMWKNFCEKNKKTFVTKILRSEKLQNSITNIYDEKKPLSTNFYCSLTDLPNRNVVYKNLSKVDREQIPLYLKASVAIPAFNPPQALNNTKYYDGALIDMIPVFPLLKKDLDYVICIYFDDICYKFENSNFDNKTIKIVFPSNSLIKHYFYFEEKNIKEMINSGYQKGISVFENFFSNGYKDLDYIYAAIKEQNAGNDKKLRLTGDVLATNFNKITQRFLNRNIQ